MLTIVTFVYIGYAVWWINFCIREKNLNDLTCRKR